MTKERLQEIRSLAEKHEAYTPILSSGILSECVAQIEAQDLRIAALESALRQIIERYAGMGTMAIDGWQDMARAMMTDAYRALNEGKK